MKTLQFLFVVVLLFFLHFSSFSQFKELASLWENINAIDDSSTISEKKKLNLLYNVKNTIEKSNLVNDTTYVFALIKISEYEELVNKNFSKAIDYAKKALAINAQLKSKGSKRLSVIGYFGISFIYNQQNLYRNALNYYDTTLALCKNVNDVSAYQLYSHYAKTYIYLLTGDYQKAIDESNFGIYLALQKKDTLYYVYLLNRKAWALYHINDLSQALKLLKEISPLAQKQNYIGELSTALKLTALIYEKRNEVDSALQFHNKAIAASISTSYFPQIASDYNDLGNFYMNNLQQYKKASECFYRTLFYAARIEGAPEQSSKNILAYTNLGENSLLQNKLDEAGKFFLSTFSNLNINLHNDINKNPSSLQLSSVANKDVVFGLMNIKTRLHLKQFQKTKQNTFLNLCIQTCVLTDSVMTQLRHEQLGEQSKLYWRNKTRDFFSTAMEASYLANKPEYAFYFMERSRAVLLSDQLNEIGAAAFLPQSVIEKQRNYQNRLIEAERKLSALNESSADYQNIQNLYFSLRAEAERYIHSLTISYPVYYQYKYADNIPSLKELQQHLAKNNQRFLHYFFGDTATYILAITPAGTKFLRITEKEFNKKQLDEFLQLCSNKQSLNNNNNYNTFAELSNSLYKAIFQPLQLTGGKVVICADNTVIPFDALCTDKNGKHFLLNDYIFSYVYSARFLMKQFNNVHPKGNFLGFAPVSFSTNHKVADLKNSATALNASAAFFQNKKLFTHKNASRSNFFNYVPAYSIVSVFSHAYADTTDNEPVLFMQDSVIHLSELQMLNHPATQLVLLSACQTNVGKTATGEGIYSLARGFATAGIPSITATLWSADEQTIYIISEKLNKYLSEGMSKDEALQKAKLYFIENNSSEKMLPYYWANMILIGNTDAVILTTSRSNYWWWIAGFCFILLSLLVAWKKKFSKLKK